MDTNGVVQKPSETALFAALRRAIAHKEFANEKFGPDYLAARFLPAHFRFFLKFKKIRLNTKERLARFLPGMNEYMVARTVYFDRLFVDALNNGIPQIVLLGAGYDSRAYRFAELNHTTKIFELDIAPTQNRKKEILKKSRIVIPSQVKLVSINFNEEALGLVLENAGYDNQEKTLFIWEGVSYYLNEDSINSTLNFVARTSHHERIIAFDYTVTLSEENMNKYYGAEKFAEAMRENHKNEELLFSINEGKMESFLAQRGLRMIEHLDNAEIERSFLIDNNGALLGQITGHFCFVSASKQKNK